MAKVFITGASGGFGQLTTQNLLASGHQVVGTMRGTTGKNKEAAAALAAAGAQVVEMDVTSDESVNQGVARAIELLGGLDVVINNAGVGVLGMIEHFTVEDFKRVFEVNVFGVQRVNRAALPHLRQQGSGLIVFVSSLLGRMTIPFYGPYNASKWALEGMAENYRAELSGFGVQSCIVEPGGYPTSFMDNLIKPSENSRADGYGDFMQAPEGMFKSFEGALAANPEQRPEKVSEAIANLVNAAPAERPFRTVVDKMGMGDAITPYNEALHQLTHGIYSNFGIEGMLTVK